MARILNTADLPRDTTDIPLGPETRLWIYNGLDCMVTKEVWEKIHPQVTADLYADLIYTFERAMQAPALDMMARGFRIDMNRRSELTYRLKSRQSRLEKWFQMLAVAATDDGVNYKSHIQLKELFYEQMKLPKQYLKVKGERKLSVGRESLEKLRIHFWALPLINTILKLRDLDKKIQVLDSGIDEDGRFRASFNVAGTETGRWSSSKSPFGRGTNFQNITEEMRQIFISDPGWKLGNGDLEQAESRAVAYLSGDRNYVEACESGDLHTAVARFIWPNFGWTGDITLDRAIAERPHYRHFSKRDLAKRCGHASNYMGTAWTLARHLKLDQSLAEEFQDLYFATFPGIRSWHTDTVEELQSTGCLTTPLGRKRRFFGRLNDDHTIREAVAFVPQSTIADTVNLAIYRLWKSLRGRVQLLGQIYDSVIFQYPEDDHEAPHLVRKVMEIPIPVKGRILLMPAEVKVGYRWYKKELVPPGSPSEAQQKPPMEGDILDWEIV